MQTLENQLKKLRMQAILNTLQQHHDYARKHKLSYLDFLTLLLEEECSRRSTNAYKRRLKQSRLSCQKTLETYEFGFQPELDRQKINELATCRFIEEGSNVVFMGKPGVGKTHLANALGLKAIEKGYKVQLVHANELIDRLHRSRADDSYEKTIQKYSRSDLLIIDELGFKQLPQGGANDFFEVIRRRYEKAPVIITTNRDFKSWEQLFGDAVIASAMIDRIVHHADIIKITGESYRLNKAGVKTGNQEKKNS